MPALENLEVLTVASPELTQELRSGVFDVFHASYRHANDAYLEKSLSGLRYTSIARTRAGRVVAFAIGETRMLDIPRTGMQRVSLAGIACIHPEWRRRRLFSALASAALAVDDAPNPATNWLVAGRVAHPVSFRSFMSVPSAVPRPGVRLTSWHKEVGRAIARTYGAHDFDADRFVCIGDGAGPGEPALDIDSVSEEEALFFKHVDRTNGDALLVVGWVPDAPPGWLPVHTPT